MALLLEATFDGSSPFQGFNLSGHQYCCDNKSITQVTAPDGIGKALRYELNRTDPIVSSSRRAEIELTSSVNGGQESERWYGLRYWFEKYDTDSGAESILQWHDEDGSTPPLSIQIQSGQMRVTQSFLATGNTYNAIGNVVTGRWIDIVLHVKWTTSTNGIIEVWRDGVKIVNKTGIKTNSSGGSYMKIGINKWSWAPGGGTSNVSTPRIFYIDQFRIGDAASSFSEVSPSSGSVPVNIPPSVSIGSDRAITLPTSSVTLTATASDSDGTIASYAWSKVSGGSATFTAPSSSTTNVTGLVEGVYVFRATATDNSGASISDDVTITVNPAVVVPPPPDDTVRITDNQGNVLDSFTSTSFKVEGKSGSGWAVIAQIAINGSSSTISVTKP